MGTTPNLLITLIQASQSQKEVTANQAFDDLDLALTNNVVEQMPDTHFILPLNDALYNMVFIFTGTLTANRGVTLPSNKKLYIVSNQTSSSPALSLVFGTASSPTGRTAVIPQSAANGYVILYCDGLNVDVVVEGVPDLQISASDIVNGLLALAVGGTAANLSQTGGTSQVVRQSAKGAALTVSQLAASDLSNGTTGTGAVVLSSAPTLSGIVFIIQAGGGAMILEGTGAADQPFFSFNQAGVTKWAVYPSASSTPNFIFHDQINNLDTLTLFPSTGAASFVGPVTPGKYTVVGLPSGVEGQHAYATNGRKVGEGPGAGTGVPVYFSNGSWRVFSTDLAVAS